MLNTPVNANDPSGHNCVGEPEECIKDDGTKGGGFGGGTPSVPTVPLPVTLPNPSDDLEHPHGGGNSDGADSSNALDLLIGLHPNSCTLDACYLPPDCWNPYDNYYFCGKNVPERWPDYYNFTFGFSIPGIGALISVAPTVTLDRFGNFYGGAGVSFGPEAVLGISPSLVGGWISDGPPSEERSEEFLSGMFVNVSGGAVLGGGWNWNPVNGGHSWDFGLFWPQVSATVGGTGYIDAHREKPLWGP